MPPQGDKDNRSVKKNMSEIEEIRKKRMEELMASSNEDISYPDIPLKMTDQNFHETIKKYSLVVVDFWAAWCGPCRMLAPTIDELARDYAGRIVFGKLNTDENRATSMGHQVMSIPTLIVFKDGQAVDRIVGALPKEALEARLQKHL